MRGLKLAAICVAVSLLLGTGCLWVLDRILGHHGTGEPEWRFPETYVDHSDGSRYITLDEDGVARVSDIPNRDASCAGSSEKNITGEGVWEAAGYARIQIEAEGRVILVGSGAYRGEPDWERLTVAICDGGDFFQLYHTILFPPRDQ